MDMTLPLEMPNVAMSPFGELNMLKFIHINQSNFLFEVLPFYDAVI